MCKKSRLLALVIAILCLPPLPARAGTVMVSIKPLYSLVAGVMGTTGKPVLIVTGAQSPHNYQLKPSQATALQDAEAVFYISPDLETFLVRPLANLPSSVLKIAMAKQKNMALLAVRTPGGQKAHDPVRYDPHIWLSADNAKMMVGYIIQYLSNLHPENADTYIKNGAALMVRLQHLDTQIQKQLTPDRGASYIAYHDAFQYFEHEFGLHSDGSLTQDPEQEPGAQRIAAVRAALKDGKANCVVSGPEHNGRLIKTVTGGTKAQIAVIDEVGGTISDGPDQYFTLMHRIADGFAHCLVP